MNHAPFTIKETLRFGFRAFKDNFWLLLEISLLSLFIATSSQVLINLVMRKPLFSDVSFKNTVVSIFTDESKVEIQQIDDSTSQTPSAPIKLVQLLLAILISIVAMIAQLFLVMGWNQIGLDIYDTGKSSFKRLLAPSKKAITFWITAFLYGIICCFGTLLLIIPGIIWGLKYSFADLVVVESDANPIEALKSSGQLTYGHKWDILFFYFVSFFILVASLITLIGPFILVYVLFLSRVYIYRKLQERWDRQHLPPTPFMP